MTVGKVGFTIMTRDCYTSYQFLRGEMGIRSYKFEVGFFELIFSFSY
jgi:hypothetical protein